MLLRVMLLVSLAIALGSCTMPAGQNGEIQRAITEIQQQVSELKAQQTRQQTQISTSAWEVRKLRNAIDAYGSATFDPVASQGFQRLDTSLGTLVVSIENIEPYGDGVKVRASVGNLTSAAIAGADGTAKYGTSSPALDFEKDDQAFEKYSSWAASLKTTPISISRDLNEGSWNSVLIVLPGIKASEFGHLEISLDASHLKLQKGT